MACFRRSTFTLLLAVLPLASLFPHVSMALYTSIFTTVTKGHSVAVITICTAIVAVVGALALPGYRRLMWMLFSAACFGAWAQGEHFRRIWLVWLSSSSDVLLAAFALNMLALLAIPMVIFARRNHVRVEPIIAVGFGAVLLVQVVTIVFPWLLHLLGYNRSVNLAIPYPQAALPVIDSMGVRDSFPRALGAGSSPNEAGAILLLAWPAILFNWRSWTAGRTELLLRATAVFAALVTIMLTFTRAAYLGLICQVLLLLFVWRARSGVRLGRGTVVAVAVLVVGTVLLVLASDAFRLRWWSLLAPTDMSVTNRIKLFGTALFLLAERPFCGWGVGVFNTLYNVFHRMPLVDYGFADAHSGILHGLLNTGIAAWGLLVLAVLGLRPWKTLRIIPLWMLASLSGILVSLLSDNLFTRRLSVSVPLCLLLGICALYASRYETKRRARVRSGYVVASILAGLWILAFAIRPMAPTDRLVRNIKRVMDRARADVSIAVLNLNTNESWGRHQDRPHASMLATLAIIARTCQSIPPESTVGIHDFRLTALGPTAFDVYVAPADWLNLAVSQPSHNAVGSLLGALPVNSLTRTAVDLFGPESTATVSTPQPCQICGASLDIMDASPDHHPLAERMTTATATAVLHAFVQLTESSTEPGRMAAAAMATNSDHVGLTRYLVRGPWLLHCTANTGNLREEVLLVDKGPANKWGVAMLYSSHLPARPRADSVANRMFADVGWRLFCYFDALPPLAKPTFPK